MFRDGAMRIISAADALGIRGMIVHAISEEARAFYLALGFDPSPLEPMTLMITLQTVRTILADGTTTPVNVIANARFGTVIYENVELELRQAIEPWNVLGSCKKLVHLTLER